MAPDPYRELWWGQRDIDIYERRHYRHYLDFDGVDVSDRTYEASIRDVRGGTVAIAEFAVDMTAAAEGTVLLELTEDDTAGMPAFAVWDVVETIDGVRTPLLSGSVVVTGWVTP